MDDSPLGDFGRLSPELRNEIYELCLTQTGTIDIDPHQHITGKRTAPRIIVALHIKVVQSKLSGHMTKYVALPRHAFALVQTCKYIRSECGKLLYSCNDFSIGLEALDQTPDTPGAALWNGEEPDVYQDTTLSACSPEMRQKIKQVLAPWRVFDNMIGPGNAAAIRSVALRLLPNASKMKHATRLGGTLLTLAKEAVLKQQLQMTLTITFPYQSEIVVNVGRETTRDSLRSLAERSKRSRWLVRRIGAWEQGVDMFERAGQTEPAVDMTGNEAD